MENRKRKINKLYYFYLIIYIIKEQNKTLSKLDLKPKLENNNNNNNKGIK